MKTKRPYFLPKDTSLREWKAQKRAELKDVIKAAGIYQMGCAYCPDYDSETHDLFEALNKMKKSHSYKEWG